MKQPFIFAALAVTLIGVAPAQAQHIAADLLPPYEVSTIVASMEMRPLDRPVWRNGRYVVNAIDRHGREVRVILDAQDGQVIAVRPRMRDYVYRPRYGAPPPPPEYPRGVPYEPRFDSRYDAPPPPPATIPGGPADDDDDEFFDNDRQQGSLMPPSYPRRTSPAPREATTGSVPRRVTSIGPTDRKAHPAKAANGKTAVNKDEAGKNEIDKNAAPVPRPRPVIANAKPDVPKIETSPASGQPTASDNNVSDDKKESKPDAKESANAKPAKTEAAKTEEPKADIRIIDMSKPKSDEKPEEKPGEAIRF